MLNFLLVIIAISLTGCASAMPNFYDGHYYMVGDSNCVDGRPLSNNRIMCIDSSGKETGWREAMTDQQLQMYNNERQQLIQTIKTTNTNCYRTYGGGMNCTTY